MRCLNRASRARSIGKPARGKIQAAFFAFSAAISSVKRVKR